MSVGEEEKDGKPKSNAEKSLFGGGAAVTMGDRDEMPKMSVLAACLP